MVSTPQCKLLKYSSNDSDVNTSLTLIYWNNAIWFSRRCIPDTLAC